MEDCEQCPDFKLCQNLLGFLDNQILLKPNHNVSLMNSGKYSSNQFLDMTRLLLNMKH